MAFAWGHLTDHLIVLSLSFLEVFANPIVRNPIAVSIGAIAGALSRYYITQWFRHHFSLGLPYGTLVINLSGAWAMGFFVTFLLERSLSVPPEIRLLVAVGFLGSYTTFSTYELEAFLLFRSHSPLISVLYWLGSAVFGAISLYLGIVMARWIS